MTVTTNKRSPSTKFKKLLKVLQVRFLTEHTYIIRFERDDFDFKAGQYVSVGIKDSLQHREYSIYSRENDNYLEILVREVLNGNVSVQLKNCEVGQIVEVNGPYGFGKIDMDHMYSKKHIFIASGTGIAPFHSCVASYKNIDYTILHGVSYVKEGYDKKDYDQERYVLSTSRENNGNFHGRVTDYLQNYQVTPDMLFYICGNSNMIFSAYDILVKKGVAKEAIQLEVYF